MKAKLRSEYSEIESGISIRIEESPSSLSPPISPSSDLQNEGADSETTNRIIGLLQRSSTWNCFNVQRCGRTG